MKRERPTAEYLRSVLDYDQTTGVFRWRQRTGVATSVNARDAGQVAGGPQKPYGYVQIRIDGVLYYGHVLAWVCVIGEWPTATIDHENGQPSDNRFGNLREASQGQNCCNRGARKEYAPKGVYWDAARKKWRAAIGLGGKLIHLGRFDTLEAAHAAYCAAALELHGEFANFGHGPATNATVAAGPPLAGVVAW